MEEGQKILLAALAARKISVLRVEGKMLFLAHDYEVEIEGPTLFKLSEDGYVVGPFDAAEELADFVAEDLGGRGLL